MPAVELAAHTLRVCRPFLRAPVVRDRLALRCDGLGSGVGAQDARAVVFAPTGEVIASGVLPIADGAIAAWREIPLDDAVTLTADHRVGVHGGPATAHYQSIVRGTSGLVARWTFDDGSLIDDVGGRTLTNATGIPVSTAGRFDEGMRFTSSGAGGTNGYLQLAHDPTLFGSSMTVELFVRYSASNPAGSMLRANQNTGNGFLVTGQTNGSLVVQLAAGNVTTPTGLLSSSSFAAIVITHDGTTLRIYVNGALVASQTIAYVPGTAALRIGGTTGGLAFGGDIDEVAIYNRALTQAEVTDRLAGIFTGGRSARIWIDPSDPAVPEVGDPYGDGTAAINPALAVPVGALQLVAPSDVEARDTDFDLFARADTHLQLIERADTDLQLIERRDTDLAFVGKGL